MTFDHKYSLTEIENLMPFERDLYIAFTSEELRKQKEEIEKLRNAK